MQRKRHPLTHLVLSALLVTSGVWASKPGDIITFDAGLYPYPAGINARGDVTGTTLNSEDFSNRGFVRSVNGTVEVFNLISPGSPASYGTSAAAINEAGTVTGYFSDEIDQEFRGHGFLRTPDGMVTIFDAPGAVSTSPTSLNNRGEVAGYFTDVENRSMGFVRRIDGSFEVIDFPDSAGFVLCTGINNGGDVTGYYPDQDGVQRSFVRTATGLTSIFNFVETPPYGGGTLANSINDRGDVAGSLIGSDYISRGFVRDRDGAVTIFAVLDGQEPGTFVSAINNAGEVAGYYRDPGGWDRSFVRSPRGALVLFGGGRGTYASSINARGDVTGAQVGGTEEAPAQLGFIRR